MAIAKSHVAQLTPHGDIQSSNPHSPIVTIKKKNLVAIALYLSWADFELYATSILLNGISIYIWLSCGLSFVIFSIMVVQNYKQTYVCNEAHLLFTLGTSW